MKHAIALVLKPVNCVGRLRGRRSTTGFQVMPQPVLNELMGPDQNFL